MQLDEKNNPLNAEENQSAIEVKITDEVPEVKTETIEQTAEIVPENNAEITENVAGILPETETEVLEKSETATTDEKCKSVPKKTRRISVGGFISAILFIVIIFLAVILLVFDIDNKIEDFLSKEENSVTDTAKNPNYDESDVEHIVINLPVSDKPVVEPKYYVDEETGLLTTEGVAQKVMDSQVLIGCYTDNPYQMSSLGSGVILTSDGFILTNAHVVDGVSAIKVKLNNGNQYEAELIGIDVDIDIAVVKINADETLIAAELGNSDQAVLGEQVGAIGAGGSLENSITFGHIACKSREIYTLYEKSGKLDCIQTTAGINPGSSGGALVNMYGQVIGIPVGGYDPSLFDGIGFAININDVIPVAEDLMRYGYVVGRAKIGILYIPIDPTTAAMYEIPFGLVIESFEPDCDIATKGLMPFDVITHIDGIEITNYAMVADILAEKYAGETVTLSIYRRTITEEVSEFDVEITLAQK